MASHGEGGDDGGGPGDAGGDGGCGACDDGMFCNGEERCDPSSPAADASAVAVLRMMN